MIAEKKLQDKKLQGDVAETLSSKEDLPSMYMLNTLAKHYTPGVLSDEKVLKGNTLRSKWTVIKRVLYINIYTLLSIALTIDVIIRSVTTGLILDNILAATGLLLCGVFLSLIIFFVTKRNNKTKYALLGRLWASDYYKKRFIFFKDFNLDISKPIGKDLAKVLDFMIWSERFLDIHYPKEGTLIEKATRTIINKYKAIVFDDDKRVLASLNDSIIVNDILSVNDGLMTITKKDWLPEGKFYDIAKKYSTKKEVELSKFKVKSGLVLDKFEEQSNIRLLDLIGKSDI